MGQIWKRVREAAAASSAGTLERGGATDPDNDADASMGAGDDLDTSPCPSCNATGIKGSDLCPRCDGAGTMMKESTCGPYWVYSDDPEWTELREATHPQWEWMQEAPRTFSSDVRKKYAASGVALPDGSYPIPDGDALDRAVLAYGHNPTPTVKAHIIERARSLGKTDSLPDGWKSSKEVGKSSFGGNKAPPFGKDKKDAKGDKGSGKDDKEDNKPPWLKNKESAEDVLGMMDRLSALEHEMGTWSSLREAKPASMTPAFSTPIRVRTKDGREGYQVALIREGQGNSEDDQWYSADAVKELCESGVCEGMQAYSDHPTEDEEEQRPERSVKEIVGTYHDVTFKESGSGKAYAQAVFVPLTLDENHPRYGWVVTLAEAAARSQAPQPICGISLLGLSAGDDGQRPDGSQGRIVSMIRPYSGDIVTTAGAGGGFLRQVMESARALRNRSPKEELTPMKALEYQTKMRETAKRVREADSDESREAALKEMEALEGESIDSVADLTIETLREAAPGLVDEIGQQATANDSKTIEELREENASLKGTLGKFSDAINVTQALREAGVEDPIELQVLAGRVKERGLTDAADIKRMVETQRAYDEQREAALLAKMRESFGGDLGDTEIEGVVARIPMAAMPANGGLDLLRESGLPTVTSDAD